VPKDRHGRFSTELVERDQRSEKALVAPLAGMDVPGVSTRKVKAITGGAVRPQLLDPGDQRDQRQTRRRPGGFAGRRLDEACPYLILDVRYERVRDKAIVLGAGEEIEEEGVVPAGAFDLAAGGALVLVGDRGDPPPGGAAGDRHQPGRPPQHPRGRARRSREPLELARFPAPAARARS